MTDQPSDSPAVVEPTAEPVTPVTPAKPVEQPAELAKLFIRRAFRSDMQRERASDFERETLRTAAVPVESELAQDYLAWRRSVLWIAAATLGITGILRIIELIRTLVEMPEGTSALLVLVQTVLLLTIPVGTPFIVMAAMSWTTLNKSRNLARIGWLIMFATPFVIALIPWARITTETGGMDSQTAAGMIALNGLSIGIYLFMAVGPATISLCTGVIRSSMTLKTLLPESLSPGWATAFFAPTYAIILLSLFVIVNQTLASFLLMFGLMLLVAGPLVYVWYIRDILRAHTADEVSAVVAGVRMKAGIVTAAGVLLIVLTAIDAGMGIDVFMMLQFAVAVLGGMFALSVVGADFIIAAIYQGFAQAKAFHEGREAADLEQKFDGLRAAGVTELPRPRFPTGKGDSNGEAAEVEPVGAGASSGERKTDA